MQAMLLIEQFVQVKPDCRPDLKGLCEHDKPSKTALGARIGCNCLVRNPSQSLGLSRATIIGRLLLLF
jgi:hypothetical protein